MFNGERKRGKETEVKRDRQTERDRKREIKMRKRFQENRKNFNNSSSTIQMQFTNNFFHIRIYWKKINAYLT